MDPGRDKRTPPQRRRPDTTQAGVPERRGTPLRANPRRKALAVARGERIRLGLLLTAGTVFLPWAFYWGLLLP